MSGNLGETSTRNLGRNLCFQRTRNSTSADMSEYSGMGRITKPETNPQVHRNPEFGHQQPHARFLHAQATSTRGQRCSSSYSSLRLTWNSHINFRQGHVNRDTPPDSFKDSASSIPHTDPGFVLATSSNSSGNRYTMTYPAAQCASKLAPSPQIQTIPSPPTCCSTQRFASRHQPRSISTIKSSSSRNDGMSICTYWLPKEWMGSRRLDWL